VENLIKCGAMDCFGNKRSQLLAIMDNALDVASQKQKDKISGQIDLFGEEEFATVNDPVIPNIPELPKSELLRLEKELIGFYVTGHPLDEFRSALKKFTGLNQLTEFNFRDGENVTVGGIISENKIRTTKNGDRMANFILEDFSGTINCIAFPRCFSSYGGEIIQDNIVKIRGVVKLDEEVPRIFANSVEKLGKNAEQVDIYIKKEQNNLENQQAMAAIFGKYHGINPVFLHLIGTKKVIKTSPKYWVNAKEEGFYAEIKKIFGELSLEAVK
jgi:DNA polymerase-3 subunit alpha